MPCWRWRASASRDRTRRPVQTVPMFRRVHQIAQRADDLDRAVEFYRDTLGLPLITRFDPPGLAFFDLGNVRLLIERGANPATLYLEVDDIDGAVATLEAAG